MLKYCTVVNFKKPRQSKDLYFMPAILIKYWIGLPRM